MENPFGRSPAEREGREMMKFSAATMPADRHPNSNEDASFMLPEKGRAGVFDGVSMANGGELSAEFARDVAMHRLKDAPVSSSVEEAKELLTKTLLAAHSYNVDYGNRRSLDLTTTATVTEIVQEGSRRFVVGAHVGDTHLSLIREGKLKVVTLDETLSILVMANQNDEAEKRRIQEIYSTYEKPEELSALGWDPHTFLSRNSTILQALGMKDQELKVRIFAEELLPGDKLLLSSDGLHDNLTSKEIVAHSSSVTELVSAAKARSREGRDKNFRSKDDDITALLISPEL